MKSKLIAIVGVVVAVVVVAVVAILVGGLAVGGDDNGTAGKKAVRSGGPTTVDTTDSDPGTTTDPEDPAFKAALSKPVEDSLYPNVGDPIVDSLHYGLDLTWDPEDKVLTGRAEVAFRATASQQEFQLDFGEGLEVTAATLDAQEVEVTHVGKDLVIKAPVTKDQRYLLVVDYEGTPEPADAPTTRSDFSTTGFTITDDGDVWTMQEPMAPTRGTRSTTSPPTRRSTTSRSPHRRPGSASPTASSPRRQRSTATPSAGGTSTVPRRRT